MISGFNVYSISIFFLGYKYWWVNTYIGFQLLLQFHTPWTYSMKDQ